MVAILVLFFALAAADYGTSSNLKREYGVPVYSNSAKDTSSYSASMYNRAGDSTSQTSTHMPIMPYAFAWAVKDEPSYNDYAHSAKSDGKVLTGSYRVLLPDGRTQMVSYKADEHGYVADVKYGGEAKYPVYNAAHTSENKYTEQEPTSKSTTVEPVMMYPARRVSNEEPAKITSSKVMYSASKASEPEPTMESYTVAEPVETVSAADAELISITEPSLPMPTYGGSKSIETGY